MGVRNRCRAFNAHAHAATRPHLVSRNERSNAHRAGGFCMYGRQLPFLFLLWFVLCVFALPAYSQTAQEETLSGPDSHETGQGPHGHLFGDWGGERTRLEEKGVNFDLQYISDSLWNIKSEQKERLANWSRVRGTVDINFGSLIHQQGLYFHATALWQGGGN